MDAARILLIGRNQAKTASVINALKKRYNVVTASNGAQAAALAAENPPDAIIIDAVSLRTPGDRICRELHQTLGETPIVHIHPGPDDKADSSADVLLLHPFTSRKLINIIERLITLVDDQIVACGPFVLNVARRVLVAHGQETQLTPKLALLVEMFLRAPCTTISRKTIMEHVWKTDYLGDTRTLDVHIRWIRQAIELDAGKPRYLVTVRGVGYRLDVAEAPEEMQEEIVVLEP